MSGHSKWSTIKRKKGAIDAERSKIFQKLSKELYVAAKNGEADPTNNAALRLVIEKAKAANMPKDNIQSAIDKAKNQGSGDDFQMVRYEGYGPFGIAVMVDCLTDNKNRTAPMVRSAFAKRNGNLGTDGSVSYLFEKKGVLVTEKTKPEDEVMMNVLDHGAIDFVSNEDSYEIYTTPEDFLQVKEGLKDLGIEEFAVSEVTFVPSNTVSLTEEETNKVLSLIEALEGIEDVQEVYHNLEV